MTDKGHEFLRVDTLAELQAKGRMVLRGRHLPVLVVGEQGRLRALDNRCPHMGFPLDRGTVEDGILTCHWHHARFDLASGCTFDLWADDVPTCPVQVRGEDVWVQPVFDHADPVGHWRRRLGTAWPTIWIWSSPRRCEACRQKASQQRRCCARSRLFGTQTGEGRRSSPGSWRASQCKR